MPKFCSKAAEELNTVRQKLFGNYQKITINFNFNMLRFSA